MLMTGPRRWNVDALEVQVHASAQAAGQAMAMAVAGHLRELTSVAEINVAFASAPSQDAFLDALVAEPAVPWGRVNAFHVDEYIGLPDGHPSALGAYLRERLAERVPLLGFYPLLHPFETPAEAAERYTNLLAEHPLAVACIGIGENGHLAFNDPFVAELDDPLAVKRAPLDLTSRRQQVFDGAFPRVEDVPTEALTLTLPSILGAAALHVIVPGPRKASAVHAALAGDVDMACPASALRTHPNAVLYLDEAAASQLDR